MCLCQKTGSVRHSSVWSTVSASIPPNTNSSSCDHLEKKCKIFPMDYWFAFSERPGDNINSFGWFYGQSMLEHRHAHTCEKVHITATATSSTARASLRTGVQPRGGQREGHDSLWQGQSPDRLVSNCLVVISKILLGDIAARVMKKINTQTPIYSRILKCSIYLLNIH